MNMTVMPARYEHQLRAAPAGAACFRCPDCGSFLDAPRADPATGVLARKCAACLVWHPLAARPSPGQGDQS